MTGIISFDQAIDLSKGKARSVLLANGFSIAHFSYQTLLERSGIQADDPVHLLFEAIETNDFEKVIRAIEDASVVSQAYGDSKSASNFGKDAQRVREALVHAIRDVHPSHREDIGDAIPNCIEFLKNFSNVFTLNYDLLLYWVILEDTRRFSDGFGLGKKANGFRGPFEVGANCNIYNVHGGLHLFKTASGETEKCLMGRQGIIDAIADVIVDAKRLPIYVAEGSSIAKMNRINSNGYLKHCFSQLSSMEGSCFIYGHSADQNDEHIYRAIFKSQVDHLFFCFHSPSAALEKLDGELARYQRLFKSKVKYTFVDSESVNVWKK
jgi:hypothetical protein